MKSRASKHFRLSAPIFPCLLSILILLPSPFSLGQGYELKADGTHEDIEKLAAERFTVTFRDSETSVLPKIDRETKRRYPVPFGESYFTVEDHIAIETELNLDGTVLRIWDALNTILIKSTKEEAERLRSRPDVIAVEQDDVLTIETTQSNPGWALDRLDEEYPDTPDNSFTYTNTGSGQTIYILDSGLDVGESFITAEFGSRASVIHDYNSGGDGSDCNSHGTHVASVAAGATYGVAKGATIIMAKVMQECSVNVIGSVVTDSLDWLAIYEDPGTMVNMSLGPNNAECQFSSNIPLEEAIVNATDAGILVFTSAGNNNCNISGIN